jgi:hypothetical protein
VYKAEEEEEGYKVEEVEEGQEVSFSYRGGAEAAAKEGAEATMEATARVHTILHLRVERRRRLFNTKF